MKIPVGSLDPSIRTVHIWGGGIAGLLMAHFLSRQGFTIELYEKSSQLGGKIATKITEEGLVESGPNAVFATPEIEKWLRDLGLAVLPANSPLKRRIWDGKPHSPFFKIIKLLPKLFKQTPPVTPSTTLYDYFFPLLGKDTDWLLSTALQGVYGQGARELTVMSVWPSLTGETYLRAMRSIKRSKARSVSFPHGMGEWVKALRESINGPIHLNAKSFVMRPNTIIATDALSAADMLQDHWPKASVHLKRVRYLPLKTTTVFSNQNIPETRGCFGFLFPRTSQARSLGCLFNHEIFPGRVRGDAKASLTFIHQASGDVDHDLKLLNFSNGATYSESWDLGLPSYDEARYSAIETLRHDPKAPKNLILFGNYVCGISLRDMIEAASSFADEARV